MEMHALEVERIALSNAVYLAAERWAKIILGEKPYSLPDRDVAIAMVSAVVAALPEPQTPTWATPEAKAVLDAIAEEWSSSRIDHVNHLGLIHGSILNAFLASLKPKTRVLPERWIGERQGGFAIFDTQFAADAWAASCDGYICHIPSPTVEDK